MNKITSGDDYIFSKKTPHTSRYLYEPINKILEKAKVERVLDIGCGNGSLAAYLSNTGFDITGIEPSESGIINARAAVPQGTFYKMGVYDVPDLMKEKDFDAVVSTEVIEHLFYPRELLRFAKAKLRPAGIIILTTPYHGYLKNLVLSLTGKWDVHHTPLWDGGHIKFWSEATLSQLMKEEGFAVTGFTGCGRIPYMWKSMLLSGKLEN